MQQGYKPKKGITNMPPGYLSNTNSPQSNIKEPKINLVQTAVKRLDGLIAELKALDEAIEKGSESEQFDKETPMPFGSLMCALEFLPKEINEKIDFCLELVRKIRSMIL